MQWSQLEIFPLQANQLSIKWDFVVLVYTMVVNASVETL
jgi:hypothetical protein